MRKLAWWMLAMFAASAVVLAACGDDDDDDDDDAATSTPGTPAATQAATEEPDPEDLELKVALLPIVDVLPMLVAEQEGFFADEGVSVELPVFSSAVEREAAFTAGEVDAQLTDFISTGLENRDGPFSTIVRLAYEDQPELAQFVILAAANSDIEEPADLAGVEIGISSNTVIEYETEELLMDAGLTADQIATTEVPQIPVRAQLLIEGQLQAATLPEPAASLARINGARVILDDSGKDIAASLVVFRNDSIEAKPEAIRRFLRAYERAVEAINADPTAYQELLFERANVPEPVRGQFGVPTYPAASVPSEARVMRAIDWMVSKDLLPEALAYDDIVDDSYLP